MKTIDEIAELVADELECDGVSHGPGSRVRVVASIKSVLIVNILTPEQIAEGLVAEDILLVVRDGKIHEAENQIEYLVAAIGRIEVDHA